MNSFLWRTIRCSGPRDAILGSISSSILRRGHVRSSCYRRRMMLGLTLLGFRRRVEEMMCEVLLYGGRDATVRKVFGPRYRTSDFPVGGGTLIFRR